MNIDEMYAGLLLSACVCIPALILETMMHRRKSNDVLSVFKPNEKLTAPEVCRRVREKRGNQESVSFVYNTLNRLARQEDKLDWTQSIVWIDGKEVIRKEFFLRG